MANKHVYAKRLRRKAEAVWEHIAWCEEESEIIIEDLDDVMHEDMVQRHVKKSPTKFLKELKADRREWEKRLPVVEKELEELMEEDIEHIKNFDNGMGYAFRINANECRRYAWASIADR